MLKMAKKGQKMAKFLENSLYLVSVRNKRETGLEPATSTLARWSSTTELFPQENLQILNSVFAFQCQATLFASAICLKTSTLHLREGGLEPPSLAALEPKSSVYANFTTLAVKPPTLQ